MLIDHLPLPLLELPVLDQPWKRSWLRNPPPESTHNGVGDHFTVGREFVDLFRKKYQLSSRASVLDVGCGSGRLALAFTRYLSSRGRYAGFDVRHESVDWCSRYITPRYPHFTFRAIDVLNHAYGPAGSQPASSFTFPYPDASFDFVVLTSVFTHMRPDDVQRYLHEIRRVLKIGGQCFITWFVLNEETRRLTAEHRSTLGFHWQHGECWAADERAVEIATGYDEPWILNAYQNAKLTISDEITRGWWPGRARSAHYQDAIIAIRRD